VHARTDTDGRGTVPADSLALANEYGPAGGERVHHLTAGLSWVVPGGVLVSPYVTLASGLPYNITTGADDNGDGLFADRPAIAEPGEPGAIQTPAGLLRLSPAPGDRILGRNAALGDAQRRLDLHLSRRFDTGAGAAFVVAVNVQNLLNWHNYDRHNGVLSSPEFGEPTRARDARWVQFSAGFSF
jgi:hypothetical protein